MNPLAAEPMWVPSMASASDANPSETMAHLRDNCLMGFGKHSQLTYKQVVTEHADYCEWCKKVGSHDPSPAMKNFLEYLGVESFGTDKGATPFWFGKYKNTGYTYKDVLRVDRDYCRWAIGELEEGRLSGGPLQDFAQWARSSLEKDPPALGCSHIRRIPYQYVESRWVSPSQLSF